jgi:hypothetical protein
MRFGIRTTGAAAGLAVVGLLAGCGGSSSPSKADFVKQADALCQQTNKQNPPPPQPRNAKQASVQAAREIQIRTALDSKLRALKAPGSAKADFDAYNAATKRIIAQFGLMKGAADKNDEKTYSKYQQALAVARTGREASAKKIGFKVCGRVVSPPPKQ